MIDKNIVINIRHDAKSGCSTGICPHCGKVIDDFVGSPKKCQFCKKPVAWDESKSLKPCPFCGADLEPCDEWGAKHPENDCFLIKITEIFPFRVDYTDADEWNRRA